MPFIVINERTYQLFLENSEYIHNIKFKKVKLRNSITNEVLDDAYHVVMPSKIVDINDAKELSGIGYATCHFDENNKGDSMFKKI